MNDDDLAFLPANDQAALLRELAIEIAEAVNATRS